MSEIMNNRQKSLSLLILVSVFALFACGPEKVVQIRVTPTPDPAIVVAAASETPTDIPTITPTPPPTATPTPTQTATNTAVIPTQAGETPVSGPTYVGPIIGPDYVRPTLPPPTSEPFVFPTTTNTPRGGTGPVELDRTPIPVAQLDPDQMGLQVYSQTDFSDFERAIGDANRTGVKWIKIQANWGFLQGNGPNQFDQLELFERQVQLASRPEGVRVLLSVAKAPLWARSVQDEAGPPDDPQHLADFITYMLRDTKIGESVDAIEIWNEPNLQREWRGTYAFSGAGYMQLFGPSYDAIRALTPSITIVTAGLAPTSTTGGTIDDRVFLQQMYDNGLRNYIDDPNLVIGVHPYGWWHAPDARCCGDPNTQPGWDEDPHFYFMENIEAIRNIMERNGHGNSQMWITEFGWPTWEGLPEPAPEAWLTYLTPAEQAIYNMRAFEIGQELSYIGPMFLWNLNFANETTVERRDEIVSFSLLIPSLPVRERPGYWALARSTGAIE